MSLCSHFRPACLGVLLMGAAAGRASAHAAEQGFVLLLPTDLYIAGGVASVVLTVMILAVVPHTALKAMYRPRRLWRRLPPWVAMATSCLSALVLAGLVAVGLMGSTDPLKNPLPLAVWTLWWIGLVSLQGLAGDLWRYLNPLTGPARLVGTLSRRGAPFRYPKRLGLAPAFLLLLALVAFVLVDANPTDPRRLSGIVAAYFVVNLALILCFGPRWLVRGEALTVFLQTYARTALIGRRGGWTAVGLWGWQALARPATTTGHALLILVLLGSGSFDGLNETFWWLAAIGVNPLEFPGRSAVMRETFLGLVAFNAGLVGCFAAAVWLGERLVQSRVPFGLAFCTLAPSILPIALGYHIGHYLPTFLVDVQYALAAASDPLARGDDFLGLGKFYVTTGFFNAGPTVRAIWLTQAGAVVAGHVLAILLAHGLALRLHNEAGRATLSQAPLAAFMVIYTFFGLWLLASPRGL